MTLMYRAILTETEATHNQYGDKGLQHLRYRSLPKILLHGNPKDDPVYGYELTEYHKFWNELTETKHNLLEYGGGPSILPLISACPHVQNIIFCDYTVSNRKAVEAWRQNGHDAFDWKSSFDYVVTKLEGKEQEEVNKREDELREKIRAIVPGDLHNKELLQIPRDVAGKYGPPFDVVSTSLCLEAVVESEEEYKQAVLNLTKLLKPGGYLLMFGVLGESFYAVGNHKFYCFPLTKMLVLESMKEAGLEVRMREDSTLAPSLLGDQPDQPCADFDSLFFTVGRASLV